MKKLLALLPLAALILFNACQKETSFEAGNNPSEGSLQADGSGDCLPKTVTGVYVQGDALSGANNQILVDIDVTKTGSYTVYTDTVNGVHFRVTGIFSGLGLTTVSLRGTGTPFSSGTFNFVVQYQGQICSVPITFLPTGAGGPATFTFNSASGNCANAVVNGSYAIGQALNSTNTVDLEINVTAVGTYNITTTLNGMTFMGSGVFPTTGIQIVTLNGTGTPTSGGSSVFPVTAGASTCNFTVTIGSAGAGTLAGSPGACAPITVNGTYTVGAALAAGNTVEVQVDVTAVGTYAISTNTVAGFSFAGSGTFAATGNQTIILTGTGSPNAAGTQSFTVTFGSSTCTFTVDVVTAIIDYFPRTANSNWSYEWDDIPNDSLLRVTNSMLTISGNPYNVFRITDDASAGFDSSGYYRKSGGNYIEFIDWKYMYGSDNSFWTDYIFLKDDQAQGHNWKSAAFAGNFTDPGPPPVPFSLTLRLSYTIVQKDVPVSLTTSTGTVNYQNVIVVEEKWEAEATPGVWQDASSLVGYSRSYYARNIGLIKYEYFDETGTLDSQFELRRYQIF